ncbi:MAG: PorP/SprF family type IX secretion system membrane protein, partial [Chitinophagales bacterium]|nr:PorP/SprF family type IX secretion system membrane protein [Chitinophagales bacterium]
MKKSLLLSVNLFVFLQIKLSSQEVAFSQIHAFPMQLNPAMAGFFQGDLRVSGIYRNQWFSIQPWTDAFQTVGLALDAAFLRGKYKRNYLGTGIQFLSDQAGDLRLRNLNSAINISYSKGLGKGDTKHSLAIGFQGLVRTFSINTSKAIFSDGVNENLNSNVTNFNIGTGLRYHIAFRSRLSWYLGLSYTNILRADERFVVQNFQRTPLITAHSGAVIDVTERFNVLPSVMFVWNQQWQLNTGAFVQYIFDVFSDERNGISFGLFSRFAQPLPDALISTIRLDYKNFQGVISYDFNLSELKTASFGQGAVELG